MVSARTGNSTRLCDAPAAAHSHHNAGDGRIRCLIVRTVALLSRAHDRICLRGLVRPRVSLSGYYIDIAFGDLPKFAADRFGTDGGSYSSRHFTYSDIAHRSIFTLRTDGCWRLRRRSCRLWMLSCDWIFLSFAPTHRSRSGATNTRFRTRDLSTC